MEQLKEEIKQLQSKNTSLVSQDALKELSLTGYQTKYYKKMEEANSFQSRIKSLEEKLAELENIKSELELKVNELECLKSEAISKPVIGGDVEKNIIKGHGVHCSAESDLSKYFIRGKNMDQAGKIDTDVLDHTDDKSASIPEESVILGYASSPRVDTEISPKVSDEIDINENNSNMLQEIPKVTPYLSQPDNNSGASAKAHMSSLIESHSQIRPSLEALPLPIGGTGTIPIVADAVGSSLRKSTLMSPLSACILLALLIIAVMWFVVLRREWNIGRLKKPLPHNKKNERLRDMWVR